MSFSRLRLRLTGSFALAFLAGLTLLNGASFLFARHQASQRLTRRADAIADEVITAVQREAADTPARSLAAAAQAALREWPEGPEGVVVYSRDGQRVAETGDSTLTLHAPTSQIAALNGARGVATVAGGSARLAERRVTTAPAFGVAVLLPTTGIRAETETLAWWLAISSPVVILLSVGAGYLLARRALVPLDQLATAIGAIAPDRLDQRIPVQSPADEIDRLAGQFNGLLARLEQARARNRRFLRQAAHQIKTPLTLVLGEAALGEAALGLDRPRTLEAYRAALRRVRVAAEQMTRRVDELLLLAHAEAGERLPLDALVEIDGLALDCADLMRGRATALGRRLDLVRVEQLEVRGNEQLLREALLELLENACRYAGGSIPIGISAWRSGDEVWLEVASDGPPLDGVAVRAEENVEANGLGLTIVRWIAGEHQGRLAYRHTNGVNTFAVVLPAGAAHATPKRAPRERPEQALVG